MIEIWNPRWHDRKVLVATYKVSEGNNQIKFTKSKALQDKIFDVPGSVIRKCPVETNGTIRCYSVPLDAVIGER